MGWFWSSSRIEQSEIPLSPPRQLDEKLGGTFWAPKADIWAEELTKNASIANSNSQCPVDHSSWFKKKAEASSAKPKREEPISQCPVKHEEPKSACPVDHTKFNKLNNIPHLATSKLPGQQMDLPVERTRSSIPRGEDQGEGFWEYPSPQQMLNAMARKSGLEEIPEDSVESMVDVHNFLNEGVWQEVLDWEKPYTQESSITPRLLKFQGRPNDLSPRARILQMMGWVYPAKYGVPPPFDRHDWTVLRAVPGKAGEWQKVRYVIDFYEIPEEHDDIPTFTVDVRPAADSLGNIYDRARKACGPVVSKALGW